LALYLYTSGIHPRSEELVQATQDWERGRIDRRTLKRKFKEDVISFISLQEELEFDFFSDGQMTEAWNDIFRPFTERSEGLKKGPLVRWYNTNTFYYVPLIVDKLYSEGDILSSIIERSVIKRFKTKLVIPDPLTFAECSENRTSMKFEDIMFNYCENILNVELRRLESLGLSYVQFSSPSLAARFRQPPVTRERVLLVGEAIKSSLKGTNLRSGFYSYFGNCSPYMPEIYDMIPTDDIGFDLTETDFREIVGSEKCFIAGVVNSRSSYVEKVVDVAKIVERLMDKFHDIIICPSSELHYIPRKYADMKLRVLHQVKRMLND
jgi:5-methyltetrahydropteroyltriglutamate--homocysteine methyltransferase